MQRLALVEKLCLWLPLVAALGVAAPRATAETPRFLQRAEWVDGPVMTCDTYGGPEAIPEQLAGDWQVSLCVRPAFYRGHAWIRFENLETGEVHTVGRFQRNVRATRLRETGEELYPRTRVAGLHWDFDIRYEHEVRAGQYVVDSVVVHNPWIYREPLYGHGSLRNNCVTYARDAWEYYSGTRYDLNLIHAPETFLREIASEGIARETRRHDELRRLPAIE